MNAKTLANKIRKEIAKKRAAKNSKIIRMEVIDGVHWIGNYSIGLSK